jgi:hypothetical protein
MTDSTLYLGRITDNDDPDAKGRVKCQRLDRPDGVVTKWARVMMPFGGLLRRRADSARLHLWR